VIWQRLNIFAASFEKKKILKTNFQKTKNYRLWKLTTRFELSKNEIFR